MGKARSARALDMVNFFVADVQTGFGPFTVVGCGSRSTGLPAASI
jgi:hypothetical protein